ncbi:hypothetical protein EC973_001214 [Apophysomyces ossiformis]|uniref:Uncharacterized protein n=1 Tax=Apophysomyces ossiformis TaxID=679940 RepID=A0A8H7ENQ5_9FUNG|nr:hypothetical protein EC973_001214 [Apophysomyces ossiformis]
MNSVVCILKNAILSLTEPRTFEDTGEVANQVEANGISRQNDKEGRHLYDHFKLPTEQPGWSSHDESKRYLITPPKADNFTITGRPNVPIPRSRLVWGASEGWQYELDVPQIIDLNTMPMTFTLRLRWGKQAISHIGTCRIKQCLVQTGYAKGAFSL